MPTGKVDPFKIPPVWAIVLPEQLSAEVGVVHDTTAPHTLRSFGLVILVGNPAMVGFSVSLTFTVKLAEKVLPAASIAV